MCVLAGWLADAEVCRRDKKSFWGVGGLEARGAPELRKYVRWNRLDRYQPIENHLLPKNAGHLQKVVGLARSAKSCWVSAKMCASTEEKKWFVLGTGAPAREKRMEEELGVLFVIIIAPFS
jgi:hypothetical protein